MQELKSLLIQETILELPVEWPKIEQKTDIEISYHVSVCIHPVFVVYFCVNHAQLLQIRVFPAPQFFLYFTVDYSRVKLKPLRDIEHSDYINANYVKVSIKCEKYKIMFKYVCLIDVIMTVPRYFPSRGSAHCV